MVQKEDDPVRWLAANIRVDFRGNSEIMRVSLTSEKPEEAAILVKAVVEAYMNEVVDADRNARNGRIGDIGQACTTKKRRKCATARAISGPWPSN